MSEPREDVGLETGAPSDMEIVGPKNNIPVRFSHLNILTQVRQEYDVDRLNRLAQSMVDTEEDGTPYLNVIQAPTVIQLSHRQAVEYIEKINDIFGKQHSVEELTPMSTRPSKNRRHYIIVVAGHRRSLAIPIAAKMLGKDPHKLMIRSHVLEGDTSVRTAIKIQYRENFYQKPESWEDAYAINAILKEGLDSGAYGSFIDCAKDLSIDEDRVSRAYRFQTLPEPVREQVKEDTLHFGRALMLTKVFASIAFKDCQENLSDEQKAQFAKRLQENKLYLKDILPFVLPERRAILDDSFMFYTTKMTTFRSNKKAQTYADQIVNANISDVVDFKLFVDTQERIDRENDQLQRAAARELAVYSLRHLTSILYGDGVRVEAGRQTVLGGSSRVIRLLGALVRGMEAAAQPGRDNEAATLRAIDEATGAASTLIEELERSHSIEER